MIKGFIRIKNNYEAEMHIAVSEIASFGPDDKYHPDQGVRLILKDGRFIRTSWRYSSESIASAIEEAS